MSKFILMYAALSAVAMYLCLHLCPAIWTIHTPVSDWAARVISFAVGALYVSRRNAKEEAR